MDYRQRIIDVAAGMFRTYGIRAVTMDMLAAEMNISKRTIYEVFTDKDELLKGVLKFMLVKQQELISRVFSESENIIEAIFRMLDLMIDHFQKMSPAFQMDMKKMHNDIIENKGIMVDFPYFSSNSEVIRRGIKEGVFRDDINIEIINKCMLEVLRMSNDKYLFPPDNFANKDVIKNFYINYLRGISTPEGLKLIDYYEKQ